jgi:hypothetical protein
MEQFDATHCYVSVQGQQHQVYQNQYWDLPAWDSGQANRVYDILMGNERPQHRVKGSLLPSMQIDYQRMTLWDSRTGARLTADSQLQALLDGLSIEFPGWILVELKQERRERHAVDFLAAQGLLQPCSFSKYYRTMQIWMEMCHGSWGGNSELKRYGARLGCAYAVQQSLILKNRDDVIE